MIYIVIVDFGRIEEFFIAYLFPVAGFIVRLCLFVWEGRCVVIVFVYEVLIK